LYQEQQSQWKRGIAQSFQAAEIIAVYDENDFAIFRTCFFRAFGINDMTQFSNFLGPGAQYYDCELQRQRCKNLQRNK
jgi:hypothetical protein